MYLTLTSLVCFTNVYHLKRFICLDKSVPEGKIAKLDRQAWQLQAQLRESYPCLLLANPKHHDALKILSNSLAANRSQKMSWMTGDLFGEWIRKFGSSLRAQDRKVVLLIDNCPSHPEIKNLTNINLIFLPPNTTSVIQPMDQGEIHAQSLKTHYRRRTVRLRIKSLDENKPLPKITILQAMKNLM